MAEYWKSQPKKFCEYCKCWIADNKPSIDFHEKGKKHKENVKLKIDTLRKKGLKDARKQDEFESDLRAMEEAALQAMKKDLLANPSMAAQYGVKIKQKTEPTKTQQQTAATPESQASFQNQSASTSSDSSSVSLSVSSSAASVGEWHKATSPEGYTYYWNTATGESTWIKPEGYTEPAEKHETQTQQNGQETAHIDTAAEKTEEPSGVANKSSKPSHRSDPVEVESKSDSSDKGNDPVPHVDPASVRLEDIALPPEPGKTEEQPEEKPPRPSRPHGVYGGWEVIREEGPPPELDLPYNPNQEDYTEDQGPEVPVEEEPKIKFKEKRVMSLNSGQDTGVAFKKRKVNSAARKNNMKRREDND